MAIFPSKEWCEEAIRRVNADPESAAAGRGWEGDFGLVVDAEPGKLERPFVLYCRPDGGRIAEFEIMEDPDDLDETEPAYRIRAPYSVWKGLLVGALDPMVALVDRRMRVEGNVQPLIERMKYRHIADRVVSQIETEFPDGPPTEPRVRSAPVS